jgi:tetratricopeptide (TPR) repeat protein
MRIPLGFRFISCFIVPQLFAWAQHAGWVECKQWQIRNESGDKAVKELRYGEAIREYAGAVQIAQTWHCDPNDMVVSTMKLADVSHEQGRYHESEQIFLKAKSLMEHMPVGVRRRGVEATLLNDLADLYLALARYPEAEQLALQSIELRKSEYGLKRLESVVSITTLAEADLGLGKLNEAESLLRDALANAPKKGSEWVRGGVEMHLASILVGQGHQNEAEAMARTAVDDFERALGSGSPEVTKALIALATIYRTAGKYEQSIPLCQRAITSDSALFRYEHPGVARDLTELAYNYAAQKRYADAEPLYKRALEMQLRVLPPDHPDSRKTLDAYADLLRTLGRNEEAEKLRR